MIKNLTEEYAFLANDYPCLIPYKGWPYPCVTVAFQAAKAVTPTDVMSFRKKGVNARKAVKLGHSVPLPPKWDETKVAIMTALVMSKFRNDGELRRKLLATGKQLIFACNAHLDTFWGIDEELAGSNMLGEILMSVRNALKPRYMYFRVTDIAWDTSSDDEEDCKPIALPNEVHVPYTDIFKPDEDPLNTKEYLGKATDRIGDYISNEHGFCHDGFNFELVFVD